MIKSENGESDDELERGSEPKVEFDNEASKTDEVFKKEGADQKKDEVSSVCTL